MTRTYAARQLLAHGPLTLAEFVEITRWPYRAAQATLGRLMESGAVESAAAGPHRNVYRLAA